MPFLQRRSPSEPLKVVFVTHKEKTLVSPADYFTQVRWLREQYAKRGVTLPVGAFAQHLETLRSQAVRLNSHTDWGSVRQAHANLEGEVLRTTPASAAKRKLIQDFMDKMRRRGLAPAREQVH